jgi:hypothetical protein
MQVAPRLVRNSENCGQSKQISNMIRNRRTRAAARKKKISEDGE